MSTIDQLNTAARDALKNGYLDDAINHSTNLVEKARKQMVDALRLRACIWKKAAKIGQELNDILMVIQYDCNKTDAYLHAAKIYSIQGNQYKAKNILEKGLTSCPTKNEHDMIQEQIVKAKERLERCVDFITETPFDILCNITKYLDFSTVLTCMEVCVKWRSTLSHCSEPWKDVGTNIIKFWEGHSKAEILPSISHHIKRLFIHYPDDVNEATEIFKTSNLCRMEVLEIAFSTSLEINHNISKIICDTIYRMEHRLTSLRIDVTMSLPSLGQILSGCASLTKLQLYLHSIQDWTTGLPSNTSLTYAYINLRELPTDINDLEPFFRCSPNLLRAEVCPGYRFLHYDPPLDILPALKDHCPQLISIENFSGHNRQDYHHTWNETFDGFKCAALANIRSTLPLYSRLGQATDSLRSLHITTLNGGLDSTLADWRPLSAFVFKKLEYLGIEADPSTALYGHLPSILNHSCPALETLLLKSSSTGLPLTEETANQIFTAAAAGLEKLSSLYLRNLNIHGQSVRQLMHACQSTLRVIKIDTCTIDCTFLHDIARVNALEYLHINDVNADRYPEADVTEFARLVSQLPKLCNLELFDMDLSVEAAQYLCNSQAPNLTLKLTHYGEDLSEKAYEILKDIIYDDRDDYDDYYDDGDEVEEDDESNNGDNNEVV